ncbi:hypothetical protein HPB48_023521 [Haemaphysalis longicornis]|uniref:Uncharacterized protein n=1 Tax=Haemaphysalis longicornis TaxID=44386 RepID=A0A9J6H5F0_HAELO|nr:hypothetical protein HPB48_023521 [Haemaphysalis longicornis]
MRKLCLGMGSTKEEVVRFATMLKSSDKIYALNIAANKESTELLLHHLYPGFSRNYTLISLFYYWGGLHLTRRFYLVSDIIRRYNDLVRRATHCATGNNIRMCVEALELVAQNPALMEKICEGKYVGEEDAAEIVRNALGTVLGFDDYMRVSGVVKHRVSCPSGNTHKLQLSDLDDYSWRVVRRFLRVSDVFAAPS